MVHGRRSLTSPTAGSHRPRPVHRLALPGRPLYHAFTLPQLPGDEVRLAMPSHIRRSQGGGAHETPVPQRRRRSHLALLATLAILLAASFGGLGGRQPALPASAPSLAEPLDQTAGVPQSQAEASALTPVSASESLDAPTVAPRRWWLLEVARDMPPPPPPPPPRPASPQGLTLWSDGDSVSYFMTTNLFAILSGYGAVPVRGADYKISSRLTRATGSSAVLGVPFSDWFSYVPGEMGRFDPDVVVFMVGANDAGFIDASTFGEDAGRMMDLLRRDGRLVAWVGLPSFVREDLARNGPPLNSAARAAAASRSWVTFVDTSAISPDGGDGVHFGPGQARLLAQAVVTALFPGLALN